MKKPIIILGAGGHASVLIDTLYANEEEIIGILTPEVIEDWCGIPIIGDDEKVKEYSSDQVLLVNSIGSVKNPTLRAKVYRSFKNKGYKFANVIHPSAVISSSIKLSEGTQIMAGAIIQPGVQIGENVIVNTKASIDHDCVIGNNVHIAPGATISGGVEIGDNVHIGTGAVIIQNIRIEENSVVGAGAVVIRNVHLGETVVGVPAKRIGGHC